MMGDIGLCLLIKAKLPGNIYTSAGYEMGEAVGLR